MELWIGLLGLKAKPTAKGFRRFGKGKGAYVHVAAWAESYAQFEERVRRAADEIDCVLYDLDDVGLLVERLARPDCPDEFADMNETARKNKKDAVFGHFYIWEQDEAN